MTPSRLIHEQVPASLGMSVGLKELSLALRIHIPTGCYPESGWFHEGQSLDVLFVAHGIVKAQSCTPVVHYKGDVFQLHFFNEALQVPGMFNSDYG